jgi:NADPH-dependent curcumin reductase CurA
MAYKTHWQLVQWGLAPIAQIDFILAGQRGLPHIGTRRSVFGLRLLEEEPVPDILSREIRLRRHPTGLPTEDDFELAAVRIPEPQPGEVLVRNSFMSVDPYMRGRMNAGESYTASFQIGEPLTGGCVGQVVAGQHDRFKVGDYVMSFLGWREYFVSDGRDLNQIDPRVAPIQAFLGVLGMPGLTAYVGLLDIGRLKAGETVFVSAAAGAVGSVVCQIAKLKGCRVIGSAGSPAKIAWLLDEAGVDAAFNYREVTDLTAELGRHCPQGIDVYFENVGGAHLEAALQHMNNHGRIAVCGMISQYNATTPEPAPRNLGLVIGKRLTLQGFLVSDHVDRQPQFFADMAQWLAAGQIKWQETVVEGIERAPQALIGLFKGENIGKMLVKLGPSPAEK